MIARRLMVAEPITVVTTPAALGAPLLSRAEFADRTLRIAPGDRLDRELLLEALERSGYERVDTVVAVGQWSLRGGIVDVFSPSQARPARLEFFGDDVESIRLFDPSSQRSVATLDELLVLPLVPEDGEPAGGARLLDYLPAAAPVIVDAPKLLDGPNEEAPAEPSLRERLAGRQLVELSLVAGMSSGAAGVSGAAEFVLETQEVARFTGRFNQLAVEIGRWRVEGFRVRLTAADDRQAEHLRQILREHGIEAVVAASLDGAESLAVVVGECSAGFSVPSLGVIVLTEGEVFGSRRRSLRRPKYQRGAALTAFTDLAIGDIVVHEDHGLGRYLGLQTMKVGDREGDFLLLEYAEANRLYLPVERLDRISKYLGADTDAARLDRLGGASWQRVKESVRAALREMAEGLLRLYAQRAVAGGHAFGTDTPWQREFEASFRFEETADQLRAIDDAKRDMESGRPMDRLVAGDVGYGKTEVALRAAFKAVGDGLQVAVLLPTTVLAQQHWSTFADRFAPFPARVELLSRFRAPKEQRAVVEGLRRGTVDVVIGTHRLLSKDVAFKNLGLLVVDEEHRFGVDHKERMKQLRASVDVLALTATPIPRTLYMSLSGVRDMSVIETAPLDRLPVETVIEPWDDALLEEALARELDRGGQVYFVHNRIETIDTIAARVQALAPRARVAVAHGQQHEHDLDEVMSRFVRSEVDVLVSTMIVESGLDVPNANTMVVNRADQLGLAQLYQLRGRVGRSHRRAYCYLVVPDLVAAAAEERLRVLEHHTDLGSGYRIALRDLELRGAGSLLGGEQSGH